MFLCAQGHPAVPDESHHPEIAWLNPGHCETLKLISRQTLSCERAETFETPKDGTLYLSQLQNLL